MRVYTIHRRGAGADLDLRPIKEGFCWPAALFALPWVLWHGLWLAGLVLAALSVAAGLALDLSGLNDAARPVVFLAIAAVFGFLANDLRRRKLERRGFHLDDVVVADGVEDAEWRFLAKRAAAGRTGP
ncbi:MAG: DUF2628 domain-containing protein [Hyphomicrobiales bacterium]|nr:DUF2628 domain-containing protein [Hyphomicrobiales bacterium]